MQAVITKYQLAIILGTETGLSDVTIPYEVVWDGPVQDRADIEALVSAVAAYQRDTVPIVAIFMPKAWGKG